MVWVCASVCEPTRELPEAHTFDFITGNVHRELPYVQRSWTGMVEDDPTQNRCTLEDVGGDPSSPWGKISSYSREQVDSMEDPVAQNRCALEDDADWMHAANVSVRELGGDPSSPWGKICSYPEQEDSLHTEARDRSESNVSIRARSDSFASFQRDRSDSSIAGVPLGVCGGFLPSFGDIHSIGTPSVTSVSSSFMGEDSSVEVSRASTNGPPMVLLARTCSFFPVVRTPIEGIPKVEIYHAPLERCRCCSQKRGWWVIHTAIMRSVRPRR